jgi:hypothetical protein
MSNDMIILTITWCAACLFILGAAPIIPDDSSEAE